MRNECLFTKTWETDASLKRKIFQKYGREKNTSMEIKKFQKMEGNKFQTYGKEKNISMLGKKFKRWKRKKYMLGKNSKGESEKIQVWKEKNTSMKEKKFKRWKGKNTSMEGKGLSMEEKGLSMEEEKYKYGRKKRKVQIQKASRTYSVKRHHTASCFNYFCSN